MNPHFFTAPFYFAFIRFRVQGSGFKVQGSRFRVKVAASPRVYMRRCPKMVFQSLVPSYQSPVTSH